MALDPLALLKLINLDLDHLTNRLLDGKRHDDEQERLKTLRSARKLLEQAVEDIEKAGKEDVLVATREATARVTTSESKRQEALVSAEKHRARAQAYRETAEDKRQQAEKLRASVAPG